MEKHAAKRRHAWSGGERNANVSHPPHQWQMGAIFSPYRGSACSIIAQAMSCSLSLSPSSFCPIVSSFPRTC